MNLDCYHHFPMAVFPDSSSPEFPTGGILCVGSILYSWKCHRNFIFNLNKKANSCCWVQYMRGYLGLGRSRLWELVWTQKEGNGQQTHRKLETCHSFYESSGMWVRWYRLGQIKKLRHHFIPLFMLKSTCKSLQVRKI